MNPKEPKPKVDSSKPSSARTALNLSASDFLERLEIELDTFGVSLHPNWDIDHLCYRTSSEEKYQTMRRTLGEMSTLLTESMVNGRLIASFEFADGFQFGDRRIDVVELPAPKSGKSTPDGFEHVEIVVDISFEELEASFSTELRTRVARRGLAKRFNPELEVELDQVNIKFHHQSLAEVIRWELNEQMAATLDKLSQLKELEKCELIPLSEREILVFGPNARRTDLHQLVLNVMTQPSAIEFRFDSSPDQLKTCLQDLHRKERSRKYGLA